MSVLEEMLEMFAITIQAELNATLHVCERGLQWRRSSDNTKLSIKQAVQELKRTELSKCGIHYFVISCHMRQIFAR